MVYKYLLVQINSSDLFFWVGFIYCVNFFFEQKEALWPLFMDGIQLRQGYRATVRRDFTLYHKVTIDLKFPEKVAANYFSILIYW